MGPQELHSGEGLAWGATSLCNGSRQAGLSATHAVVVGWFVL